MGAAAASVFAQALAYFSSGFMCFAVYTGLLHKKAVAGLLNWLQKHYFSAFLGLHGALFRGPERCPPLATLPFRAAMRIHFNVHGADGGMWLGRQPGAAGLTAASSVHAFCTMPIKDAPQVHP
jgi:hypothetical protein